jgi:hypothetical protein
MEDIIYTGVRNPKWLNEANTYLDCEVQFTHIPEEWVDFSCYASGDLPHTHAIFAECVAGDYGVIEAFVAPVLSEEERLEAIRVVRDEILQDEVDPVISNSVRFSSFTTEKQQEWGDYRQALLDMPETSTATLSWDDDALGAKWVGLDLPTKPLS